ncbi:MAG TPA: AbrB/MazE/SpoVT family DNA-binding domain-containing protein [Chloroflexota bacterium]|nr:AbrB/MazE/SpoVT family DNA-binding domain-containing protein [Chloroflexota bacterium]
MKEQMGVLTRKGQVTVPAAIRRDLGLRQGDKLTFALEGDEVRLRRGGSVVTATAGVFGKYVTKSLTAEELRAEAERAIAEEAAVRGR